MALVGCQKLELKQALWIASGPSKCEPSPLRPPPLPRVESSPHAHGCLYPVHTMLLPDTNSEAVPSATSAVGHPSEKATSTEVAEQVREYWHRYGQGLCMRLSHGSRMQRLRPTLLHLLTTLHTLRDITASLYGTRVDGVTVPETDLKMNLSDLVYATTLAIFTTDGLDAVPKSKATETRARHVMNRSVKDALAVLGAAGEGVVTDPRLVLFVANDRHAFRPSGQRRAARGSGRAQRGAGVVVSATGSAALVAAIDLAIEGLGRVAAR